jgi:anthranilate synthase/aminodeoxychorismate synthase-like glutamine amidotransferase
MLLILDNRDSFVHNLARYFERLGQRTQVERSDAIDAAAVRAMRPDAIVISPGPCTPREAGNSLGIVRSLYQELPLLGVCLGHQVIAEALGGRIIRAARPVHGQATEIVHNKDRLFDGLPSPFLAGRYHSLVVESATLPTELRATAWSTAGDLMSTAREMNQADQREAGSPAASNSPAGSIAAQQSIMAFEHIRYPAYGVQFHPESILTAYGFELLANFLRCAGLTVAGNVHELATAEVLQRSSDSTA